MDMPDDYDDADPFWLRDTFYALGCGLTLAEYRAREQERDRMRSQQWGRGDWPESVESAVRALLQGESDLFLLVDRHRGFLRFRRASDEQSGLWTFESWQRAEVCVKRFPKYHRPKWQGFGVDTVFRFVAASESKLLYLDRAELWIDLAPGGLVP